MTRQPRVGLIGPGRIGHVHRAALGRLGLAVAAVASSSLGSAQQSAEASAGARVYATPHELIAAPDIDVVHICTPNATHADLAGRALNAGKHVVCEKPLAMSDADADALVQLAAGIDRVAVVCFHFRFCAGIELLREAIRTSELGAVHLVRAHFLLDELFDLPAGHWMLDPRHGARAISMVDIGGHLLDLVSYTTGAEVAAVVGATAAAESGRDGASTAAVMRLDSDALAVAAISLAAPGHRHSLALEVMGTRATARWDHATPDCIRVVRRHGSELLGDPARLDAAEAKIAAFHRMLRATYELIASSPRGRSDRLAGFADGRRSVAVTTAIRNVASCDLMS
jgi:predicted dehydrogenase